MRSDSGPEPASVEEVLQLLDTWPRDSAEPLLPMGASRDSGHAVSERILELLVSSRHRKGSLEEMQFASCRHRLLERIDRCVTRGGPIELTLMAFPFKVPNPAKVGWRRLPDLAELASLCRLRMLHDEVQALHAPGLRLHLIHDGSYIGDVFGVANDEVRQYEAYFQYLIAKVAMESVVRTHDFTGLLLHRREDVEASLERIAARALAWFHNERDSAEWQGCFQRTLGMINLRDVSVRTASHLLEIAALGLVPGSLNGVQHRVQAAMLRYRIRDTVLHACDPRPQLFPDAIHLTSQNRPGRLAIWLVRRGDSRLPWHGVGVVDSQGRAKVLPYEVVHATPDFRPVRLRGEGAPFAYVVEPRSASAGRWPPSAAARRVA